MSTIKCYSELSTLGSFEDRFNYLKLSGAVGFPTFKNLRYLNQNLYQRSKRWKSARDVVVIRDNSCDLGIVGRDIFDKILVHHMNPLTPEDILQDSDVIYDPEFLICTSFRTHNAIHYGDQKLLFPSYVERSPRDTILW